jgi:uncharacterized repeat protein (TIGR04042 family)
LGFQPRSTNWIWELAKAILTINITNIVMPETRFKIRWPDGSEEICYSPSSIVKKYFELDRDYKLSDFVDRAQTALNLASDRVLAKYGRACGLALGQLAQLEATAAQFDSHSQPIVRVIEFIE